MCSCAGTCLLQNWAAASHWCSARSCRSTSLQPLYIQLIFKGISACDITPSIEEVPDVHVREITRKVY